MNRQEEAMGYILDYVQKTDDIEEMAKCYLMLGSLSEQIQDYDTALKFYLNGIKVNKMPANKGVAYFLYNNAGNCFNKLGKYKEGESCCKVAIVINPGLPNAYKNLGIGLEGQGDHCGAAEAYILATKVYATDNRAFNLLADLLTRQPETTSHLPGLKEEYRKCEELIGNLRVVH